MGDEAVNGANTGVCGRFMACGWGCVGYDKGGGGKGMGIKWRWEGVEKALEDDGNGGVG